MPLKARRAILAIALLVVLLGGVAYLAIRTFGVTSDLESAEQAIERRDFASAGKHLDAYLADHPQDLNARFLAAQSARRRGDYETAALHLHRIEQSGGSADAVRLERTLSDFQLGRLGEADSLLRYCREHPEAVDTPFVLEAIIEGTLNKLAPPLLPHEPFLATEALPPPLVRAQAAIEMWLANQSHHADQVQGLIWRARAAELAGRHPAALDDLRAAMSLAPEHFEARLYFGLFRYPDSPREALEQFEWLAERYPDHDRVQLARASAYRDVGRLNEGRAIVERLISAKPDDPSLFQLIGWIELDANRPHEAEAALRKVIDRMPNNSSVHHAMSRALRQQGRVDEADKYFRRAEELEVLAKQRSRTPEPK